jgi:hypothetical protein
VALGRIVMKLAYVRVAAFATCLFVAAPTIGIAAPSAAVRAACLNDAKKFCSSVIQDDEARRNCMKAHASELSAGCKEAVAAQRSAAGNGDLETCRKLARDKYFVQDGRALNRAIGPAIMRCMKNGPSAL